MFVRLRRYDTEITAYWWVKVHQNVAKKVSIADMGGTDDDGDDDDNDDDDNNNNNTKKYTNV